MTRVTYLSHSGFAVTLDKVLLVFDYTRDPSHAVEKILKQNPDMPVVFFVTHHHGGGFNTGIFEMAQNHRRVYVVSNDVPAKNIPSTLEVAGMSRGDVIDNLPGDIIVKAYGATDKGVSFLVTTKDGEKIFHAGELNDYAQENSSARDANKADEAFRVIVNRIAQENPMMDVVMFPVDEAVGSDFTRGAKIFLNTIKVRDFFPMHFDGDFHKACDFADYVPTSTTAHCLLHSPGESIKLS